MEHLMVATITSGIHVVLAHMYFLLGGGSGTYECNRQVLDKELTRITSSTAMIQRLWGDFGTSEDEDQAGHDGSCIKCYTNEKDGVSIEASREHVDLISDAWKSLNQESMYGYDENHNLSELEKFFYVI